MEQGPVSVSRSDGLLVFSGATLKAIGALEFERPEVLFPVGFYGSVDEVSGQCKWQPGETVVAAAYDTPVVVPLTRNYAGHASPRNSWPCHA